MRSSRSPPRTDRPSSSRRIRDPMLAGGASPWSVTVRSPSLPRRTSLSGRPGPRVDRTVSKASCESIAAPSTDTIWSPAFTPAREAGELGSTLRTRNPRGRFSSPDTRVLPRTPIQTGRTSPNRTRSSTMRRARSIGIAKPIPWAPPMIAVATPIMSPSTLTRGPPELPGLMEASVWMKSVYVRSFSPRTLRPRADTTPAVTVLDSPNGLPMATMVSPIIRSDEEPNRIAGRGAPGFRTRRTARSLSASDPTTSHSSSRPDRVIAVIFDAPETTCSLVRMMPLASMIAPEPSDWLVRRRGRESKPKKKSSKTEGCRRRRVCSAEMLTTEGATFSTTWTISLLRADCGEAAPRAATAPKRTAAAGSFTGSTTAQSARSFRDRKRSVPRRAGPTPDTTRLSRPWTLSRP